MVVVAADAAGIQVRRGREIRRDLRRRICVARQAGASRLREVWVPEAPVRVVAPGAAHRGGQVVGGLLVRRGEGRVPVTVAGEALDGVVTRLGEHGDDGRRRRGGRAARRGDGHLHHVVAGERSLEARHGTGAGACRGECHRGGVAGDHLETVGKGCVVARGTGGVEGNRRIDLRAGRCRGKARRNRRDAYEACLRGHAARPDRVVVRDRCRIAAAPDLAPPHRDRGGAVSRVGSRRDAHDVAGAQPGKRRRGDGPDRGRYALHGEHASARLARRHRVGRRGEVGDHGTRAFTLLGHRNVTSRGRDGKDHAVQGDHGDRVAGGRGDRNRGVAGGDGEVPGPGADDIVG